LKVVAINWPWRHTVSHDDDHDYAHVPVSDLTDTQMLRVLLRTVNALRDEVAALTQEVETRMATLEEVTAALGSAVDRIGTLLGETITAKDAAVAAAAAAQQALDDANAADAVEDAAAAQQIADLTAALAAANDALNAQVAAADAAVASIQSNVDELNALGAPVEPPVEPPVA
jgi:chromosome segregation ATPase